MYKKIIFLCVWTTLFFYGFGALSLYLSGRFFSDNGTLNGINTYFYISCKILAILCMFMAPMGLIGSLVGFLPGTNMEENDDSKNLKYKKVFFIIIWTIIFYLGSYIIIFIGVYYTLILTNVFPHWPIDEIFTKYVNEKIINIIAIVISLFLGVFGFLPGTKHPQANCKTDIAKAE